MQCAMVKKEARPSKSANFKKGNIGMANMHKKQRRQEESDRDGLVGDAVT